MKLDELNIALNFSSFFKTLEDSEKQLISTILERKEYKKDDIFFSESQPAASIYIEKGNITLTIPGSYTIFVGRGDVFGESSH